MHNFGAQNLLALILDPKCTMIDHIGTVPFAVKRTALFLDLLLDFALSFTAKLIVQKVRFCFKSNKVGF